MDCLRRLLVLLLALGFLATALIVGGAGVLHGITGGGTDDVFAGLCIGLGLSLPGLILAFIALRGRYRATEDPSNLDGFDVDV